MSRSPLPRAAQTGEPRSGEAALRASASAELVLPAPTARVPAWRLRFRLSGDEIGTPLADRAFRPDVEGLRALAVGLVVLYHASIPGLEGGFVGVDVFYVISGFVITGLLLRERAVSGTTRLVRFYARRARRILPAASFVIVVAVWASYHFLGFVRGMQIAADGRAASVFLANFHFIASGTNYISSTQPPSPLENFWSLAVEEQFYLVYPTVFLLVAAAFRRRLSLATKLATTIAALSVASYLWSIHETAVNATAAYFSPFTRAWELGLGALVAVLTPQLQRVPRPVAACAAWAGVAAVIGAALSFGAGTPYPGSLAALPVCGTALVIAGGAAVPRFGAELLLRQRPLQLLGKLSYSLYLWHWPLLVVAMEQSSTPLSLADRLAWVGVALLLSAVTYLCLENPVRHARLLAGRPALSVGLGVALAAASLGAITVIAHAYP